MLVPAPIPLAAIFYNQWIVVGDKEFVMNSVLSSYEERKGKVEPTVEMLSAR